MFNLHYLCKNKHARAFALVRCADLKSFVSVE